jgi:ferritin-like protein
VKDTPPRTLTRREMVGSAALLGAGLGALAGAPEALADGPSDPQLLTDLLHAELLIAFAYQQALQSTVLTPRARVVLGRLHSQELAHITALTAALKRLGGSPPPAPADLKAADRQLVAHHVQDKLDSITDEAGWFRVLVDLEHAVEGAYYEALANLSDPALQRLAAQILANEAQHEVMLLRLRHPGDIKQIVVSSLVQGTK